MGPLTSGKYPQSMQSLVGKRLPKFSKHEIKLVNGSFDFIGLNYYTSNYVANAPKLVNVKPNYATDPSANLTSKIFLSIIFLHSHLFIYIYIY